MEHEKITIGTIELDTGIEYDVEKGVLYKDGKIALSFSGAERQSAVFSRITLGGVGNLVTHEYLERSILNSTRHKIRLSVAKINNFLREAGIPLRIENSFDNGYSLRKVPNPSA